jgi:methionyl-tRNA formyltransferase
MTFDFTTTFMKIVFFGTPYFVTPILSILLKHFDVIGVVTTPDKKAGRKQLLTPSPVKAAYQKYLDETASETPHPPQIFTPDKLSTIHAALKNLQPDLFVVAAYGKLIPQNILDIPTFGSINIHPSLLPKYRGPSPIAQTLLNGDKITGVSFMQMDHEMDHGPLLKIVTQEVHDADTFETLANHLFQKSAALLPEVITDYTAGRITPTEQSHDQATYTKQMTKHDGFVDLKNPPLKEHLDRMIRAYYPWPTVWTQLEINNREVRIKLLPNHMIQMEGKNPATLKDFLNGYPELRGLLEKL